MAVFRVGLGPCENAPKSFRTGDSRLVALVLPGETSNNRTRSGGVSSTCVYKVKYLPRLRFFWTLERVILSRREANVSALDCMGACRVSCALPAPMAMPTSPREWLSVTIRGPPEPNLKKPKKTLDYVGAPRSRKRQDRFGLQLNPRMGDKAMK